MQSGAGDQTLSLTKQDSHIKLALEPLISFIWKYGDIPNSGGCLLLDWYLGLTLGSAGGPCSAGDQTTASCRQIIRILIHPHCSATPDVCCFAAHHRSCQVGECLCQFYSEVILDFRKFANIVYKSHMPFTSITVRAS